MEPVVGATAGAVPPAPGYFKRVREICDKYGVLLILDEVMWGMGRTGTLFACGQDGISPDIGCIAKVLGAGYQPIGRMLCSKRSTTRSQMDPVSFRTGIRIWRFLSRVLPVRPFSVNLPMVD